MSLTKPNQMSGDDMFNAIAEAVRPAAAKFETLVKQVFKGRIVNLDWQTTIDKIIVTLEINQNPLSRARDHQATEIVVIDHAEFQAWLQENEALQIDLGDFDDPSVFSLSYTEFMMEHVTKEHFAEYIKDNDLVSGLRWDNPLPKAGATV